MKAMSGPLAALFASANQFAKADLYTITLSDGSILRTTDADVSLTFGGFTFTSCAPIIDRTKVSLKIGIEVDSVNLTVKPSATDLLGGLKWQAAARQGYLDGATVLIETAYLTAWPTVIGTLHVFSGDVADVNPSRSDVKVTVKSALERLNRPFPRNVYQSVCLHTVYNTGCALAKTAFTATGIVVASPAPTKNSFKTGNAQALGYFDQGVVTFTSGANAGLKRTVRSYDPAVGFTFALPLPAPPSAGDGISVFAGCDKTIGTCRTKFNNLGRFRGMPFIPTPETVR
jgi:uncharacterized phage protein (TIGR02218 family)